MIWKILIPFGLFFSVSVVLPADTKDLENRLMEIEVIIEQKESELISLQKQLESYTEKIEQNKDRDEADQDQTARWFEEIQKLTLKIEFLKEEIQQNNTMARKIKNQLDQAYRVSIDSVKQIVAQETDPNRRIELEEEIMSLTEKRLSVSPTINSLSFDPRQVLKINPENAGDSTEYVIFRDYLQRARDEIQENLNSVVEQKQELTEIRILRNRTSRFLEDMEDSRPLLLSATGTRETYISPTPTFTDPTQTISNQIKSLINLIEQLPSDYQPTADHTWTLPIDSVNTDVTVEEYLRLLNQAEEILNHYLQIVDKKLD